MFFFLCFWQLFSAFTQVHLDSESSETSQAGNNTKNIINNQTLINDGADNLNKTSLFNSSYTEQNGSADIATKTIDVNNRHVRTGHAQLTTEHAGLTTASNVIDNTNNSHIKATVSNMSSTTAKITPSKTSPSNGAMGSTTTQTTLNNAEEGHTSTSTKLQTTTSMYISTAGEMGPSSTKQYLHGNIVNTFISFTSLFDTTFLLYSRHLDMLTVKYVYDHDLKIPLKFQWNISFKRYGQLAYNCGTE